LARTAPGQIVRFWASVDVIHLTIDGGRVKSMRSHGSACAASPTRVAALGGRLALEAGRAVARACGRGSPTE
jgi:hypothetical protein